MAEHFVSTRNILLGNYLMQKNLVIKGLSLFHDQYEQINRFRIVDLRK